MSAAISVREFLDVLGRSGLLLPAEVATFGDTVREGESAESLAERMIAGGALTRLQATNLLAGRAQGYFVGPYKLMEKLGRGTHGHVYLGEHRLLKKRVALKVLQGVGRGGEEAVKRLEREAKAAAALDHKNIAQVYDYVRDEHWTYLLMQYVEGQNLLQLLRQAGRLSPRRAARLMRQAAEGLHHAHQGGVVHRDVKPSNLMVSDGDKLTILDLGLARYDADDAGLTRGGAVLGEAAFISPEQVNDSRTVDGRADQYSLGATFWVAITGKRPPTFGKFDPPPPRSEGEAHEYEDLLGVIRRCLALDPADRFPSMGVVAAHLCALSGEAGRPPAETAPEGEPESSSIDPTALEPIPPVAAGHLARGEAATVLPSMLGEADSSSVLSAPVNAKPMLPPPPAEPRYRTSDGVRRSGAVAVAGTTRSQPAADGVRRTGTVPTTAAERRSGTMPATAAERRSGTVPATAADRRSAAVAVAAATRAAPGARTPTPVPADEALGPTPSTAETTAAATTDTPPPKEKLDENPFSFASGAAARHGKASSRSTSRTAGGSKSAHPTSTRPLPWWAWVAAVVLAAGAGLAVGLLTRLPG